MASNNGHRGSLALRVKSLSEHRSPNLEIAAQPRDLTTKNREPKKIQRPAWRTPSQFVLTFQGAKCYSLPA